MELYVVFCIQSMAEQTMTWISLIQKTSKQQTLEVNAQQLRKMQEQPSLYALVHLFLA